jgi:tetratricopeptide (TPR) repeat protein
MQHAARAIFCFAFAVFFAASAHASPQSNDDDTRRARAAFDEGMTNYNLSHFEQALANFETAYRLKHDPALLFNIGQCYRQLNRPKDAIRSYRAFLRESSDPARADEVRKLIADAEQLAAANERAAEQPPTGVQQPAGLPPSVASVHEPAGAADNKLTATAPPPPARKSRTWVWVTVGVASAVVVGAAVGLGVGLSRGNEPGTSLGSYGATFQ